MGKLNKWLERIKGFQKDQWLIVILIGVLLFIIVLPTGKKEKNKEERVAEKEAETAATEEAGRRAYEGWLEERLEEALGQMEGVGRIKVMVTLADSGEQILEKDERENRTETKEGSGDSERTGLEIELEYTTIFAEENGVKKPYIVRQKNPKVEGVVVIAEGGGNSVVAQNISKAVGALFGLETHKIMVMKME